MKEFGVAFIGLLGVVVGGWLSPWLSSRLENKKAKAKLKPELIRSLYVFGNYQKLAITLRNEFGYNGLVMRMMQVDNFKPEFPEEKRRHNNENIALLREMNRTNLDTLKILSNDLAQEESNLLALASDIKTHYGQSKYNFVNELIEPEIDKSNKQVDLFNYVASDYNTYHTEIALNFRIKLNELKSLHDSELKRITELLSNNL